MKKIAIFLLIIIMMFLGSLYLILFTKSGNSYIANYLENSFNKKQDEFTLKINDFVLTTSTIKLDANFNNNSILKIDGDLSFFKRAAILNYDIKIDDLSIFKTLLNRQLIGNLSTKGEIKGSYDDFAIVGDSNIANGKTRYAIKLSKLDIKDLKIDINGIKIEELLALLNEPLYTKGELFLIGDIIKNKEFFDGNIDFEISDATINNETINALFSQNLKQKIDYNSNGSVKLSGSKIDSNIKFNSNIADISLPNLQIDTNQNRIISDYGIVISSLENLEEFIKIPLRGNLKLDGIFKRENDNLIIDGSSNIADGKLDYNLKNSDLNLSFGGASVKKILYIIKQDEFFDSIADINLDYNLLLNSGNLKAKLKDGHFLENDFTRQIDHFVKFDLTKEIFNNGEIITKIDNKKLYNNLFLEGNSSKIESKNSFLDFEKNIIDSNIDINLKENKFSVHLTNSLNKPTVSIDMKELVKYILQKNLEKNSDKIENKLNKFLNKDSDDNSKKELLKGIRSLF